MQLPTLYFSVLMLGHVLDHFVFSSRRYTTKTKAICFGVCAFSIVATFWWFKGLAFGIDGPINEHKGLRWRNVSVSFHSSSDCEADQCTFTPAELEHIPLTDSFIITVVCDKMDSLLVHSLLELDLYRGYNGSARGTLVQLKSTSLPTDLSYNLLYLLYACDLQISPSFNKMHRMNHSLHNCMVKQKLRHSTKGIPLQNIQMISRISCGDIMFKMVSGTSDLHHSFILSYIQST
jgi:fumarate reductase subunit D